MLVKKAATRAAFYFYGMHGQPNKHEKRPNRRKLLWHISDDGKVISSRNETQESLEDSK